MPTPPFTPCATAYDLFSGEWLPQGRMRRLAKVDRRKSRAISRDYRRARRARRGRW